MFFAYIDENTKTFSSLYNDNSTNTVTITGLTAASVKGTFSGKIYDALQPGAPSSEFSGDFSVKRVN